MNESIAARVSSPGDVLADELEARGWTQSDLAAIMGRPIQAISEIIKGTKQITPDTALQLAQVFETSPSLWLNMESNYRLWLAQKSSTHTSDLIGRRRRLFETVPLRELLKRKWIEATDDIDELEQRISAFLSPASLEKNLEPSYRRNRTKNEDRTAQYAWVCRVATVAAGVDVPAYDKAVLKSRFAEFCNLMSSLEGVPASITLLRECGIRVVIVPNLPHTYTDGAAFWLYGDLEKPVIALTLRFDRVDWFWFTLIHELSHIMLGHTGTFVDELDGRQEGSEINSNEKDADGMASELLIPEQLFEDFVSGAKHRFSAVRVQNFAASIERHPGIVVGRLQREGYIQYSHLRAYLEKVGVMLKPFIDEA